MIGIRNTNRFRRFSFLRGVARLVDADGLINREDNSNFADGFQEDTNALHSDWQVVGDDIRVAIKKYKKTQ